MTAQAELVERTYTASEVLAVTGVSYRMLDHYCRAGYLDHGQPGSGIRRLFTSAEVDTVYVVAGLIRVGFTVAAAFPIARQIVADDHYETHVCDAFRLRIEVRPDLVPTDAQEGQ